MARQGSRHTLPSTFIDTLPQPPGGRGGDALERFRTLGLPDKRQEAWRQTNLRPIADQVFGLPTSEQPGEAFAAQIEQAKLPDHDHLVFVNGRCTQSTIGELPEGVKLQARSAGNRTGSGTVKVLGTATTAFEAVEALNEAYARDGLVLSLPSGAQLPRPVQIIDAVLGGHVQCHLRHQIRIADNGQANLVETVLSDGDAERLTTAIWRATVDDGAQLTLSRVQTLDDQYDHRLQRIDVTAGKDASVQIGSADLGGRLVRIDTDVTLTATGGSADVAGVYAPAGRGHIDNHTSIDHAAAHTTSRELFRGVAGGRGKGVFNGRVVVRKHAQQVESDQQTAAILLTPNAEIAAKPELEIYADDVVCAHGNSIGQLDDDALFYLRSRGISPDNARRILIDSFVAAALNEMPSSPLAARVTALLAERITVASEVKA